MMKIDPKDLNRLLEQVSDDVAAVLAKAEEAEIKTLAKASPGEEAPGEETPPGSSASAEASPEASPEGSPSEGPEGSAGDQSAAPAPDASPDGAAPAEEGSEPNPATDEAGPEALVAEYSKLPIEELKIHVMAAHAALMQAIGGGEGASPDGAAPDAGAGAPPEAASGTAPEGTAPAGTEPPMGKKEIKASPGNGGGPKVFKSEIETRLESLEKSLKEKNDTIKELEDKMGQAVQGLTKLVSRSNNVALRKSITGISFYNKPGTDIKTEVVLSKSEAIQKCNELTASKELKKSDRDRINSFVLGTAPLSTISDLLK